ncbi:MAG: hypothetical protein GY913_05230 [Proteobacteria bacterium]|nr:hypothetical protein [Pseudomonadota bacterium]MCP4916304.1 hypothetical protein [Pseudomonadota bacterium]
MILLLAGCLASKKVTGLAIVSPDATETLAVCPGIAQPLEVQLELRNGKTKHTRSSGRGHVAWRELDILFDGNPQEGTGFTLYGDPRKSVDTEYVLRVRLADRPEVDHVLRVVPRYDCAYSADYTGETGAWGSRNVWVGRDGDDGDDAETRDDGSWRGRGSNGESGRHGSDGGIGGPGGQGGHARVFVQAVEVGDQELIQVLVEGEVLRDGDWKARTRRYLIDPEGGSLTVDVRGGTGGQGEAGHSGGDGGDGGQGDPPGRAGDGGRGGRGGDGGDGGPGGYAEFIVDPGAVWALELFLVEHGGGAGGTSGDGGEGGNGEGAGQPGAPGRPGRTGQDGPPPTTTEQGLKPYF